MLRISVMARTRRKLTLVAVLCTAGALSLWAGFVQAHAMADMPNIGAAQREADQAAAVIPLHQVKDR